MISITAAVIGLALVLTVLSPFWQGRGGQLAPSSGSYEPAKLRELKQLVLNRYLKDEQAFMNGEISRSAWKQRQQFLSNRYLDLSRRLDFLKGHSQKTSAPGTEEGQKT